MAAISSATEDQTTPIVGVIGAGPVGLFTALLLAQAGINVSVFDCEPAIIQSPKSIVYFSMVLHEFKKAGILDAVLAAGEQNTDGLSWRTPAADGGRVLAHMPIGDAVSVFLGQPELAEIILRRLREYSNASVHFRHRFIRLDEQGDKVVVSLGKPPGEGENEAGGDGSVKVQFVCDFLVGADGGRSSVRKFLGIPLEGFTWDDQMFVAANVRYPLQQRSDWGLASFIVHPTDWAVVAKTGREDVWRVATGEPIGADDDAGLNDGDRRRGKKTVDMEKLRERFKRILPGDTQDQDLEFVSVAPYVCHQRCAAKYVQGRVALAGDAAHLNNPIGGLGLTTGLLDAAALGPALQKYLLNGEPYSVIEHYAEARREVFLKITNPGSIANKQRLMSTKAEDIEKREEFFRRLNDPLDVEFRKKLGEAQKAMSSTYSG